MYIACRAINNNGIEISKSKVDDTIRKYIISYNISCQKLYDLGYSYSPSDFDMVDFWLMLNEEFPKVSSVFTGSDGRVYETVDAFELAKRVYKDNEELYNLFSLVSNILEAREAIEVLSTLKKKRKQLKTKDITVIKPKLLVDGEITTTNAFDVTSKYVFECIGNKDTKDIIEVDYREVIFRKLLEYLNLPTNFERDNKSVLLGYNLTIADDIDFINSIIFGRVGVSGIYGEIYTNKIVDYYNDYYSSLKSGSKHNCMKFEHHVLNYMLNDVRDYFNVVEKNLRNKYSPLFINNNKLYLYRELNHSSNSESTKVFHLPEKVYMGAWCIDNTGSPIGVINNIRGISGEFVSANSVYSDDVLDCPIYLEKVENGMIVKQKYYPIYALNRNVNPKISVYNNKRYKLKGMDIKDLKTFILNQGVQNNIELTSNLLRGLICIKCDLVSEGCNSPYELQFDINTNTVTESEFEDACIKAENLFKLIEFDVI